MLIQSVPRVGKTRSLATIKYLMVNQTLIGCAVGGLQASALEADSAILSQAIERLILTPLAELTKETLIVVDEANAVSNRQMHHRLTPAKSSVLSDVASWGYLGVISSHSGNPNRWRQKPAGRVSASDVCRRIAACWVGRVAASTFIAGARAYL